MSNALKFYVYVYRNPLKGGEAFYVGKGFDDRMYDHIKPWVLSNDRNLHKVRTLALIEKCGIPPIIDMVGENLSQGDAFALEIETIARYGRSDLGLGQLTNLTNGGEGLCGLVRDLSGENNPNYGKRGEDSIWWGKTHTAETKERMSLTQKGKVISEAHKEAMRKPKSEAGRAAIAKARLDSSYRPSEETKQKLSEAMKGRPSPMLGRKQTDEARAKISASGKGRPSPRKGKTVTLSEEAKASLREAIAARNSQVVTCEHCGKDGKYVAMIRWHMNNCKDKL